MQGHASLIWVVEGFGESGEGDSGREMMEMIPSEDSIYKIPLM